MAVSSRALLNLDESHGTEERVGIKACDAVLFSDDPERIFKTQGLTAFEVSEAAAAKIPQEGGPFKPFLAPVHQIQRNYSHLIPTALVTARGAPAHERVVRTLRA